MNYRHAFHAGSHADVLKHAVLALALTHLKAKAKPFRFVDAHAGIGLYRLDSAEAVKTGEWEAGVGRLIARDGAALPLEPAADAALGPWRSCVREMNPPGAFEIYPGSPAIAQHLLRSDDRLTLNELHPEDVGTLREALGRDPRLTITALDALSAVKAALPPPEKRGVVLIDPPYEQDNEGQRALASIREGARRFATGVFVLWYPITGDGLSQWLVSQVQGLAIPKTLHASLSVRAAVKDGGLAGSGLIIVNPPFMLKDALDALLPPLSERLRQSSGYGWSCEWLVPEGASR
jgi:23S rRNA (adenine2030-N6)-methyltransferase